MKRRLKHQAMKGYEERKQSSVDSYSWCLTYVSCHLCALAALFLMPKTVQEAGWAQERVWVIWERKNYAAAAANLRRFYPKPSTDND